MTYSFNLLEKEWIPCRMTDGRIIQMNIVDTLCRSHETLEILHPSPLVIVALHRLLLAILHRIFGPSDWSAWRDIWKGGGFDESRVKDYLNKWKERFDLFHGQFPFYQTSAVSFDYTKSSAKLAHELASGNNKTLFDHTLMETPPVLTAADAARLVLALQAYAVGGLVTNEEGRKKQDGSADSAFLVKGAIFLVTGRNLFETLMLNLVQYNAQDEEPFAFDLKKDKPAWECDERVRAMDRLPEGYLDWLTWQSRRLRLKPEFDSHERLVVREAVIMKGYQLPDNQWRYGRETMITFKKNVNAKEGQEPWTALAFTEDKALWRDTLSLLKSVEDEHVRPKSVDWLSDLKANGVLSENRTLPLSAFGLCSDRAMIDFWRYERLPVSLIYLDNPDILYALARGLHLAESVGKILRKTTWDMVRLILLPDENDERKKLGKEAKKDINRMCDELAPARSYWPSLETPFKQLLEDLPDDRSTDENGSIVYGRQLLPKWAKIIQRAAQEAFNITSAAVGESARVLKSRAKAESAFMRRLNNVLKPYNNKKEGGEEA